MKKELSQKLFLSLVSILIVLGFLVNSTGTYAKKTIEDAGSALESTVNPTGLPKGEIAMYIGSVAQWLFGILGLIFFALATYAGIMWFTARGEDERITKAKDTLITAVVGLIIATSAYAISVFVTNAVGLGGN